MPQYQAPNPYPDFAESGDALVSQPTPSLQASGFTLNQRPSAANVNWLFRQLGRAVRYLSQGVNAVLVGAAQETDYRLIGGGSWSWNATSGVLAWSDAAYIATPGLADAANTIAAGSVTLTAGQIAYVAANVPFSTTGDTTSGSATVANLAYESGIVVGATCTGPGIPAGATVTAVSQSDSTITLSAPATASAAGVQLVFATSGALSVQAVANASFSPSSNTVVVARCVAGTGMPNHVFVGVNAGQMVLRDGEAKRLLAGGYATTVALAAGQDMPAQTVVYLSPGGVTDGNRGRVVYPADASGTFPVRANVLGITASAVTAGSNVEVVVSGRVSYAANNLSASTMHYLSATAVGKLSATAPTASGQYVVPVGFAASTNTLLLAGNVVPTLNGANINAGTVTATSVTTTGGLKSVLPMGNFYHTQASSGTTYVTYQTALDVQTGSAGRLPFVVPMTHSGSIIGISVRGYGPSGSTMTVFPQKNSNNFDNGNGGPVAMPASASGLSYSPFMKNYAPFVAGDSLSCTLSFGQSGSQLCEVFFMLELTSA